MLSTGEWWRDTLSCGTPRERQELIVQRVVTAVGQLVPGRRISSTELGLMLWPRDHRLKSDQPLINQLFQMLRNLGTNRLAYCHMSERVRGGPSGFRTDHWWFNPGPDLANPVACEGTPMIVDPSLLRQIISGLRGEYQPAYALALATKIEAMLPLQPKTEEIEW